MNQELRKDAKQIIDEAIASVQPDAAVRRALSNIVFSEHVYIVAIGKAAWQLWLPIWNALSRRRRFCEAVARDGADCVRRKRQTIRQRN